MENGPAINLNSISFRSSASCGYCQGQKSTKLWVTSGFQCPQMTPEAYQLLMDRGWRRCGLFYYLPHLFESCCQAYTIRLDTYNYRLKKSHQKVLRKIKHIHTICNDLQSIVEEPGNEDVLSPSKLIKQLEGMLNFPVELKPYLKDVKISLCNKQFQLKNVSIPVMYDSIHKSIKQIMKTFCQNLLQKVDLLIETIGYVPVDKMTLVRIKLNQIIMDVEQTCKFYEGKNSNLACNLAAILYSQIQQYWQNLLHVKLPIIAHPDLATFLQKILYTQQYDCEVQVNISKTNQLIFSSPEISIHRNIKLRLFKCILESVKNKTQQQDAVQQQLDNFINPSIPKESRIKIRWVKAQFEQDSFELYCNYQKIIHGKEHCSKESYHSFLCQPAIQDKVIIGDDGSSLNCGCWHMKYYLGDELIAVGVLDILPQSVSSVYFFYDPNYKKYSLGIYGALQEIEFIQQKQKQFPYLQYYYLGFYIQDSQKMVYKGDYQISDLLCPIRLQWVPLTRLLRKKLDLIQEALKKELEVPQNLRALEDGEIEIEIVDPQDIQDFIKSKVHLQVCQKIYKITELRQKFSDYMITLFMQLMPLVGKDLIKSFIFKYNNRG